MLRFLVENTKLWLTCVDAKVGEFFFAIPISLSKFLIDYCRYVVWAASLSFLNDLPFRRPYPSLESILSSIGRFLNSDCTVSFANSY